MAPFFSTQRGSHSLPSRSAKKSLVSRGFASRDFDRTFSFIYISLNGDANFDNVANALRNMPVPGAVGVHSVVVLKGRNAADRTQFSELEANHLLEILQLYPNARYVKLENVKLIPSNIQQAFNAPRSLDSLVLTGVTVIQRKIPVNGQLGYHSGLFHALELFERIDELVIERGNDRLEDLSTEQYSDEHLLEVATRGINYSRPKVNRVIMEDINFPRMLYAILSRTFVVLDLTSLRLTISNLNQYNLLCEVLGAARFLEDVALDISPCHRDSLQRNDCTPLNIATPLGDCLRLKTRIRRFSIAIHASHIRSRENQHANGLSWSCMVAILNNLGSSVEIIAIEFVHMMDIKTAQRLSYLEQRNWAQLREVIQDRMGGCTTNLRRVNFSQCRLEPQEPAVNSLTTNEQNYIRAHLPLPIVTFEADINAIL